jgi:hypothetical protein
MEDGRSNYRSSSSLHNGSASREAGKAFLRKAGKAILRTARKKAVHGNTMLKLKKIEERKWIVKAYNPRQHPSLAAFHRIVDCAKLIVVIHRLVEILPDGDYYFW